MKTCPKCSAQYDNETLLFCTRDGTPLVAEGPPPEFTDMPSESWDEQTVIISKPAGSGPGQPIHPSDQARIVVPTSEPAVTRNPVTAASQESRRIPPPPYEPPPQKPKIFLTIVLTALSTIAIVALALAAWWGLNGGSGNDLPVNGNLDANLFNNNANTNFNANMFNVNSNVNMNVDMNANFLNSNFNTNANFNYNVNSNANFNANVNVNRPTPTPKPSPTPKPTETPEDEDEDNTSPTPSGTPGVINAGNLNSRAQNLPVPSYPQAAKTAGITGSVAVSVMVDESGNVVSARATSGPLMLRSASEAAARRARFNPPRMGSQPVKMSGTLLYNFQ